MIKNPAKQNERQTEQPGGQSSVCPTHVGMNPTASIAFEVLVSIIIPFKQSENGSNRETSAFLKRRNISIPGTVHSEIIVSKALH